MSSRQRETKGESFTHLRCPAPLIAQSFQCPPSLHGLSGWLKAERKEKRESLKSCKKTKRKINVTACYVCRSPSRRLRKWCVKVYFHNINEWLDLKKETKNIFHIRCFFKASPEHGTIYVYIHCIINLPPTTTGATILQTTHLEWPISRLLIINY